MKKPMFRALAIGFVVIAVIIFRHTVSTSAAHANAVDPNEVAMQLGTVAQVGSQPITLDQLLKDPGPEVLGARSKLLQARYELYNVERTELNKAIDDELLKQQARKENLTVDALLDRHVKSQIKPPSEEALRIYYLGIKDNEPYEAIHDKLKEYIAQLQETKARTAYIASLRSTQPVRVMLEPPQVAPTLEAINAIGAQRAPVTMIEFADYQCPYCRRAEPNLKRLREDFKDKLRYGFKDFPLPMHEYAEKAAEAARCAGAQGQFWAMHDRLFQGDPSTLAVPALKTTARDLKLDGSRFDKCLDSGEMATAISKDKEDGRQIGLGGTPSFVVNGYFISGAAPYDVLHDFIQQQLQMSTVHQATASASDSHRICKVDLAANGRPDPNCDGSGSADKPHSNS